MILYVIPGSHPSRAAELMLRHKGIDFKRRDLITSLHKPILRARGFPRATVPALRGDDGRRVQGSTEISRYLDEVKPEPRLFPADPEQRRRVEDAERWGNDELQPVPRRISWWALLRDRSTVKDFLEGYRLGVPTGLAAKTAAPLIWMSSRYNHSTDDNVRADLANLPALLDEVDRLIDAGTIGGDEPNAADFQIATSLRLMLNFDQLAPLIEAHPRAAALARRILPEIPGRIPAVFPADWVPSGTPAS